MRQIIIELGLEIGATLDYPQLPSTLSYPQPSATLSYPLSSAAAAEALLISA